MYQIADFVAIFFPADGTYETPDTSTHCTMNTSSHGSQCMFRSTIPEMISRMYVCTIFSASMRPISGYLLGGTVAHTTPMHILSGQYIFTQSASIILTGNTLGSPTWPQRILTNQYFPTNSSPVCSGRAIFRRLHAPNACKWDKMCAIPWCQCNLRGQ